MLQESILTRPWARGVSLVAALAVSAVLMLYPYALGTTMTAATHTALPLLLVGVSAAFVHGFGFRPDNRAWRFVCGPLVAWPLMAVGIAILTFAAMR